MENIFYHNQSSLELAKQLEALREQILMSWKKDRITGHVLASKKIDQKMFVDYFGTKVLDYFLKVLRDEEKVGKCPIMIVMVRFFTEKKITLQNLFLCCSGFKNGVTNVFIQNSLIQQGEVDSNKLKALQIVFDLNFSGVIEEYVQGGYGIKEGGEMDFDTRNAHEGESAKPSEIEIPDAQKYELPETYEDEYGEDEIQEFNELEEEIVYHINEYHEKTVDYARNQALSSKLTKYAGTIILSPTFRALGESVFELAHLFSNEHNLPAFQEQRENVATLMDCFINDLISWKESLLVTGISDIHYYDNSIISNVKQIITLISPEEDSGDGCEFF